MRMWFGRRPQSCSLSALSHCPMPIRRAMRRATKASPANATIIVAKECRYVERRWNGSCKRRECRDHW